MAKKNFNELLQQKNKQTEQQQDVTELAKGMLSKKARGDTPKDIKPADD